MVALIRNVTNLPQPAGGYDNLPSPTGITATDDLARIKYYRNKLAHIKDMKITSPFFLIAWEDIKGAVERLGGSQMAEECKELRTKYLNQSTVPWNIRLQFSQIMNQWKKNDALFVETRAAKHVLKCIMENSCVTITASSGVGKTSILQHSFLKMANDGYDVLPVTNPDDIIKFYNPEQKTLFVMDDFCGTYSVNYSDLNNWETVIKRVEKFIQNKSTKIIVACRLQVYRDEKFESLTIFRTTVCNLLSDDLCLLQSERKSIADLYLGTEAADIIQYCDKYDCFPLLCKLYHDNTDLKDTEFFKNPFSVYELELEQLKKKGHFVKYCALALCVLKNNALPEEMLTEEISTLTRTVIENTCEACRLDKGTSRLSLLDELNSLEQTFIKKEHGVYKTVHDKLFDFLSYYFGKQMIQCLIKNADSNLIMERFLFERENDMDSFITIVPPKYHKMYIQRLVEDWSIGNVMHVFANNNMEQSKFRQTLLIHLNTLDESHQRQLAHTRCVSSNDTVLLQCCFRGDKPILNGVVIKKLMLIFVGLMVQVPYL
ncbi:uncharacterized protein LOC134692528 [Mytilus trossulus]|uniref:uncharacterized protein LOC134692528 n=1 Tax=Mytilus trossulus TaxID=6551 RepID=UPI0030076933